VLARVHSFILLGIDALLCEVEVDVSKSGLEKTTVVGLAQAAVKESIERVRRAILNSGFPWNVNTLLINLAPADVKKEATAVDLPMAVGVLRATGGIDTDRHKNYLIAGQPGDTDCRSIPSGLPPPQSHFLGIFTPRAVHRPTTNEKPPIHRSWSAPDDAVVLTTSNTKPMQIAKRQTKSFSFNTFISLFEPKDMVGYCGEVFQTPFENASRNWNSQFFGVVSI
jgi:hypothetical protein